MSYNKKTRKCDVCEVDDQTLQYMECDFCGAVSHTKCLNYGDKEYKIWSLKSGMCFVCEPCRQSPQLKQFKELRKQNEVIEQFIYKIDERIQTQSADTNLIGNGMTLMGENVKQALKKIIEVGEVMTNSMRELKECIQAVNANPIGRNDPGVAVASYAGAVKTVPTSKSVCVIEPKDDKQSRETTKRTVMDEIDPVNTKVSGLRGVGKSGVGILCENPKVLEEVKQIVEKKLGSDYNVSVSKPMFPRLKISGLVEKTAEEELKRMLIAQNDLDAQENDIKIVSIHATRRKVYYDAIVEVPPHLYGLLLGRGRVNIGWSVCHVRDGVDVRRCARCCGYGHLVRDCREERHRCQFCAGDHRSSTCNSATKKCVNCARSNAKYGLKLSVDHSADDGECHVYRRELQLFREKITFS